MANYENNLLIAAFDTYSSDVPVETIDFKALKDAGFEAVMLRCGYVDRKLNYDDPTAQFRPTPTYKSSWFRAATDAGLRVLTEYNFNAVVDSVNAYDGTRTLMNLTNLLSGGFKPTVGGGLILTLEDNTWVDGWDNHLITCTSNMFKKDVENVYNAIWDRFHLAPGIRTGTWFLNKSDGTATISSQMAWMDKGNDTLPLFMAGYRSEVNGKTILNNAHELLVNLIDPASTYVLVNGVQTLFQSAYLYYGNRTKWSGWEVGRVKHNSVKDRTGQPAFFRMIIWDGDKANFDAYFNFPAVVVTPPPDTGGGDTGGTGTIDLSDYVLKTDYAKDITNLQAQVNELKILMANKVGQHSHEINIIGTVGPVK